MMGNRIQHCRAVRRGSSLTAATVAVALALAVLGAPFAPASAQTLSIGPVEGEDGLPALSFGDGTTAANVIEADETPVADSARLPAVDAQLSRIAETLEGLEDFGLRFSADYRALFLSASDSLTDQSFAGSGYLTIAGQWSPFHRTAPARGSLNFTFESRQTLAGTGLTPATLGPEIGYAGQLGVTFSDQPDQFSQIYWQQIFNDGQVTLNIGYLDPTDYVDIMGVLVPRMAFFNGGSVLNFSRNYSGNAFGISGRAYLTDQVYVSGIVSDANGSLADIEWFPGGAEFFRYAEIGWTPSRDQFFSTKVNLGYWNVDAAGDGSRAFGEGILFSANATIDQWMPFLRYGISNGQASLYDEQLTIGATYTPPNYGDLAGIAYTWASPSNDALRDQGTFEAFYRYQLANQLSLTFDYQMIHNPANNTTTDLIHVFGLGMQVRL